MPRTHGKKYRAAAETIEKQKLYAPDEAVALAQGASTSAFDATLEAHVRLGVDPRHADQMVRSSVSLPHGTGKTVRIAVFANGEKAREAIEAGADLVGGEDLVKSVQGGAIDFDIALATPDLMGLVGRLGKVLGPRGLMPNPKSGTVTFDIAKAVKDVQGGRVEFRVDKFGIIHCPLGKVSFGAEKLRENFASVMEAIVRARPSATKGTYVRTVTLAATQGPGVHVDPSAASKLSAN